LTTRSLHLVPVALVSILAPAFVAAQTIPPRIFFPDLTSGPNTGGQYNKGAFVTIWGKNFGASQGTSTVKIGAGLADNYPIWSDTKITFQLGSAATTGNIVVTTSAGSSNGVSFTVRSGNIYFVSTTGNDSNNGSYTSPWKTIPNAKNTMAAGDIAYVMNGVSQTSVDDYNADLSIRTGGTSSSPIALVAYPGAVATIGNSTAAYAIRTPAVSGTKDYWVISGLKLVSNDDIDLLGVTGWRVIGNDMSCPNGSGQSACFHTDTTTNLKFLGNYVHNVGDTAGSIDKYYHAVYFTTNSTSIEAGWNTIVPNPNGSTTSGGCRAMQFYSTGGSDQFDLHVHDNLIHDAICDGINFATVNADKGTVEAYDNIVYHVGTGPDPANGSSNYACVLTGTSGTPTNNVEVYNNTFYDCGSRKNSDSGTVTLYANTRLRNNAIQQLSGEVYVGGSGRFLQPTGSNNLYYGVGNGPSGTTGNVNANPLFVNLSGFDFHLQSSSPAKDAGVTIAGLTTDFDGVTRPQGPAYDIGSYEYYQGSAATNPCDLNQDGVVNSADVQTAVNQAIGVSACSSADVDQDGQCNAIDVQRIANAASGQACRVGP
jgi:hypothetical protein